MKYPILYEANETNFGHLGIGVLTDTIQMIVTEELNGLFTARMEHTTKSNMYKELKVDRIVKADANPNLKDQLFKIIRISKKAKGVSIIHMEHVSNETVGMQLKPDVSYSGTGRQALQTWANNIVDEHDFTVYSDITHFTASGRWTIDKVENARRALGGVAGSLLDSYGGEYRFDNRHISLLQNRGEDNGVFIAYGKNLLDLEQEEEIANTFTSIYPYSVRLNEETEEEELITIPEFYIDSDYVNNYGTRKILTVDFTNEEIFDVDGLRNRAEQYIQSNNVGIPNVNLTVSFIDLSKTLDYEQLNLVEVVDIGDTVTVYFPDLDIHTKTKVIKTEYNHGLERYEEIQLGQLRASLSERIDDMIEESVHSVRQRIEIIQVSADGKNKIYRSENEPTSGMSENDIWFKPVGEQETEQYIFDGFQWIPIITSELSEANKKLISDAMDMAEQAESKAQGTIDTINTVVNDNGFTTLADLFASKISSDEFGTMFYQNAEAIGLVYEENGEQVAIIGIQDGVPYIKGRHVVLDGDTIVDGEFTVTESMIAPEAIIERLIATGIDAEDVNIINLNVDNIAGGDLELSRGFRITQNGQPVIDVNPSTGEVVANFSKLQINFKDVATQDDLDEIELKEGPQGPEGKTAYQIAVEEGFVGTEQEWLDSLKGEDGQDGPQGPAGADGSDGSDGEDGVGVVGSQVHYQTHVNGRTPPTGTWSSEVLEAEQGEYLWVRTITEYTDGQSITTYAVSYNAKDGTDGSDGSDGADGSDGVGITSHTVEYVQTDSGSTKPTSGWSENQPEAEKGKYLWTRTTINYSDGTDSVAYSTSYLATDGQNGQDGKDGSDGQDGVGVVNANVDYQIHSNGTNPPTGNWLENVPEVPQGSYLWARTITEYSNGDKVTTYAVSYNAKDGQDGNDGQDGPQGPQGPEGSDGKDGQDGVGVSDSEVRYQLSTSGSVIPTGNWLENIPSPVKGRYLWTRTIIEYTNGTSSTAYSTSYFANDGKDGQDGVDGQDGPAGKDGQDGQDGVSVTGIVEWYYHSNSPTSLTGGTWTTTRPNWAEGKYLWTKTVTTFSSGDPQETTPISLTGYHGTDGKDGRDGRQNWTWVKYALVKNPTSAQMSDTPAGMIYRGVAYNQESPTESTNPNDYTWEPMYDIEKLEDLEDSVDGFRLVLQIQDTRHDNYAPSYYKTNFEDYEVNERKINTAINAPSENTYGILTTTVVDNQVEQVFTSGSMILSRVGDVSTDSWGDWSQSETVADSDEKRTEAYGDATQFAVDLAGDVESRANAYVDSLVVPIADNLSVVNNDLLDLGAQVEADSSQWKQTFSVSGGVNEVSNSVGYADLEFWNGTGTISTVQNAELESYGSGSAFILGSNSMIEQDIIAPSGDKVFSVLIQKDLNSTGYIEIEHDDGTEFVSINTGEMFYEMIELPFTINGSNYTIRLVTEIGSEILFTNIMVNQGTERQGWSFAKDEMYGATFRMNRNGFRVYQLDGTQYTAMTPDEFAGYAIVGGVWQRTFALNGDTTQMKKAYVEEELRIGGISQVRIDEGDTKGIAFIRSGN